MKFIPQHFPVGTVFTLNEDMRTYLDENDKLTYTVRSIVRNGVDSYVLKTGEYRTFLDGAQIEKGYNISHVTSIVKRGDGPVLIDHGWYGVSQQRGLLLKDIELSKANLEDAKGRGYYSTYSPRYVVYWEAAKFAPVGSMLDVDELFVAIVDQTWCTRWEDPRYTAISMPVFHINRKRLRKFIKQNLNRFLINVKEAVKEEERQNQRLYEQEMEDDWRENGDFDINTHDALLPAASNDDQCSPLDPQIVGEPL
jgi:hypothetical protein